MTSPLPYPTSPRRNSGRRYFAIDPESYGCPVNEEDFAYTWHWFQNVRQLYTTAAAENRYVLFTADQ